MVDIILDGIEDFFIDESLVSKIPEGELEINDQEQRYYEAQEGSKRGTIEIKRTCAYISYGNSCGFASSGRIAYVNNGYNDRTVRVTVRVTWRRGIDSGQYDRVGIIAPGSRIRLGCTKTNNIPVTEYTFTVVGCQVV